MAKTTTGGIEILPKNADAKTLNKTHKFMFGKYKGQSVGDIVKSDPTYIHYCQARVAWIKFASSILDETGYKEVDDTPPFLVDSTKLGQSMATIEAISKGIDPVGNKGVRQVHGLSDNVDLLPLLGYMLDLGKEVLNKFEEGTPFTPKEVGA